MTRMVNITMMLPFYDVITRYLRGNRLLGRCNTFMIPSWNVNCAGFESFKKLLLAFTPASFALESEESEIRSLIMKVY